MYLMHKWWARKPHNIIAEYINAYTQTRGHGARPLYGVRGRAYRGGSLGLLAIGFDVNPLATFIAINTGKPCNISAIRKSFNKLKSDCAILRSRLYGTKCYQCGGDGEISHQIFERIGELDLLQETWLNA